MRREARKRTIRSGESGHILALAVLMTSILMAFALTIGTAASSASGETSSRRGRTLQLALAEAGLNATIHELKMGNLSGVGTEGAPITFSGGSYWTTAQDNGNATYTITSVGTYGQGRRIVQALLRESGHVFHHALFAANSSEDEEYVMDIGGEDDEADEVRGDVYSGNDIRFWGDADVTGSARAKGTIEGRGGEEGVSQPGFDFSRIDYETLADVSVADEFNANQSYVWDDAGGNAWQVPADNGAHIFRKNASDRSRECAGTTKDDFFLEDPYERVGVDRGQDGTDPYVITTTDEVGVDGHRCVYYIDGNLWIHNRPSFSFSFASVGSKGTQITFVVKGNIYFSDNIFLEDPEKDGVAFIAVKDADEIDSGNIYFGDPSGGTLEYMRAFMYAENDFVANNISASGSTRVEVHGTMAAGNQVAIARTFDSHHSKLIVELDERVKEGDLNLPGIPTQDQDISYNIVAWLELSPHLP